MHTHEARSNIVVIDSAPVERSGIVTLMSRFTDLGVCGIAETEAEGMRLVESERPDVVTVDLNGDDPMATRIAQRLRTLNLPAILLVFSATIEKSKAAAWLEAGATGYVEKSAPLAEIVETIRNLLRGGSFIPKPLLNLDGLEKRSTRDWAVSRISDLSFPDRDLLSLIGEGFTIEQAANQLGATEQSTVKRVQAVKRHLGAKDEHEFMLLAAFWYLDFTCTGDFAL